MSQTLKIHASAAQREGHQGEQRSTEDVSQSICAEKRTKNAITGMNLPLP